MAEVIISELILETDDESEDDDSTLIFNTVLKTVMLRESRVRIENYMTEVVSRFSAIEFKRVYRISVDCFQHICQILSTCPEMHVRSADFGGRDRITLERTVLVALRYLGHQENIRLLSNIFNISDSSVIVCRERVISALNSMKDRYIKWPLDRATKLAIEAKFKEKRGFPGVIGCVDGTHIQIKPPKEHPQSYVNRKSYHSIILQAVCLPDMYISNCYSGWPGSVHDSRVLRNSDLWNDAEQACEQNYHILGDGAYPIKKWLMTPFRDTGHLSHQQKRYNFAHSATRTIIERVFALLKGRFRRLHYIETRHVQMANDIIISCCVLHNITIDYGDVAVDLMDPLEIQLNVYNPRGPGPDPDGVAKRDNICRHLH